MECSNNSGTIVHGEADAKMKNISDNSVQLIWTDPPFNTNNTQRLLSTGKSYQDKHINYEDMLCKVFRECHRVLAITGVLCVCLDYREVHTAKMMLDSIFGKDCFRGEIIWHFELGSISKSWWTNKHNTILTYSKTDSPLFKFDEVPTTIRKSPKGKYVDPKKVTSVWSFTMSNSDAQRVGYPNQKPIEIIEPFINVHTNPGDLVLDPFGGSGSVGEAARKHGRKFYLIDSNVEAVDVMTKRFNG